MKNKYGWVGAGVVLIALQSSVYAGALTNDFTEANTDFLTFGIGQMRNAGTGELTVSGVSGTVTKAILYWQGPTNSSDLMVNANVTFDGHVIAGTNIGGLASDNCWGYTNSQTYKADITSIVSGNGTYSLANFIKADADIDGAQLLVFFNDGNASNNQDVIVYSGNDSNKAFAGPPPDTAGWQGNFNVPNYSGGTVNLHLVVADGQVSGVDETFSFGSMSQPMSWDGLASQTGHGTSLNRGLWDSIQFDVTSTLTNGENSIDYYSTGVVNDCLSLVVAALAAPAGSVIPLSSAAAGMKAVPALSSTWLLILTLITTGFGLRRFADKRKLYK